MKAKAWLNLTEAQAGGAIIDSSNIKKHRMDVFDLASIASPNPVAECASRIREDVNSFLEKNLEGESPYLALGLTREQFEARLQTIRAIFAL
jgi:hypothetical protein